jgi:Uma2 family endonuclease
MTAIIEPKELATNSTETILLHNISWSTYESLLRDLPDAPNPRLTYDRGDLLIMVTSSEHEETNWCIATLIQTIAEEFEIEWRAFGSTTYKRKDLKRGFEPDSCYYFKNEARMRGKKRLDLSKDPPPELVVEIDITHPSLNKLPIFAAFGVPEVWRFKREQIEIYVLSGPEYLRVDRSLALPALTAQTITTFVAQGNEMGRLEWVKNLRHWARQQKASQE